MTILRTAGRRAIGFAFGTLSAVAACVVAAPADAPAPTPFVLYCRGPLASTRGARPETPFRWAGYRAADFAPGPGECAWADRLARGAELRTKDRATGHVGNSLVNLHGGVIKNAIYEFAVYTDASVGDRLFVTRVIGRVTPPFSADPTPP